MKFDYQARSKTGKIQQGVIEASSRKGALDILEKYGLYITSLKQKQKKPFLQKSVLSLGKVSQRDVVVFTRQFGVMLSSAIPSVEALRAQVNQTEKPEFREKILKMAEAVETGKSLSDALGLYPKIFNSFYRSVVKSGEATGKVSDSLVYLADHLERDYNLHQEIKTAMIYPVFVILIFIGVFFLMVFFIVPRISEVLKAFTGKLPWSTRMIMASSNFIRGGGWIVVFLLLGILGFLPFYLKKSKRTSKFYDRITLRLPIVGDFKKKIYLTLFAENLSVLIASGLPIVQALKITGNIIPNSVYRDIFKEAEKEVARGEKISAVLEKYPREIPPFVCQIISTGEETGRLEKTLKSVVNFYRQEVDRKINGLTAILEPLLILVLGVGVGILAVSIFIPLFKIGMSSF